MHKRSGFFQTEAYRTVDLGDFNWSLTTEALEIDVSLEYK